jgi:hypothetical protein
MKTTTIFLLISCILNIKCISQNDRSGLTNHMQLGKYNTVIERVELTEQTRGTNRIFTFEPLSSSISLNGNINKTELPPANWKNITEQASAIDLSKISTYVAPTTGRYSDSVLSSTIIITSGGKAYESSSFDAGIPPKELEGLYQLLRGKSQIIKKK